MFHVLFLLVLSFNLLEFKSSINVISMIIMKIGTMKTGMKATMSGKKLKTTTSKIRMRESRALRAILAEQQYSSFNQPPAILP